ncbi:MAG: IS630 family transposase [Albidovulum sp.]|nr:IS630 family transposase [Albidovulum sp.]
MASVYLCFQDEARIGQKVMPARVRAQRGTRPRVPRDHRYGYCYLFSAIFPEAGVAVGHIYDRTNTNQMNRHLLDIAASVPDGRHALAVLDGAGWHRSKALEIPANAALRRLPPYSPELNPVETVFQFLKSRHFASQVVETADAIKEKVGAVRSDFINSPDRTRTLVARSRGELARGTSGELSVLPKLFEYLEIFRNWYYGCYNAAHLGEEGWFRWEASMARDASDRR